MESTSEPMKIHISLATYLLLTMAGCYRCEERGLTFIKGKGEMRTFWLKSEDASRKQEKKVKRLDEWNGTPDLLQLGDSGDDYFLKNPSTKSLSNINGSFLFNALKDPNYTSHLPSLCNSKNFPSHDCYMCQKKKYLFQKYHQELRHHCQRFKCQLEYVSSSSDTDSMQNACLCSKKIRSDSTASNRSLSLAPQIPPRE